jgi:hypothetical protein
MLHLSWEWKTIDLGPVDAERCSTCGKLQPFHLYLQYRCGSLNWISRVVEKKTYLRLCDVCRRGDPPDPKQVEASLGRNPIPLLDRSGPWVLIGGFVLMLVLLVVHNL